VPSAAGRRLGGRRAPSAESSFALALAPHDPALGRVHDYLDTNDLNRRVVGTLSAEVIR
jgi:hypothetical protein